MQNTPLFKDRKAQSCTIKWLEAALELIVVKVVVDVEGMTSARRSEQMQFSTTDLESDVASS